MLRWLLFLLLPLSAWSRNHPAMIATLNPRHVERVIGAGAVYSGAGWGMRISGEQILMVDNLSQQKLNHWLMDYMLAADWQEGGRFSMQNSLSAAWLWQDRRIGPFDAHPVAFLNAGISLYNSLNRNFTFGAGPQLQFILHPLHKLIDIPFSASATASYIFRLSGKDDYPLGLQAGISLRFRLTKLNPMLY